MANHSVVKVHREFILPINYRVIPSNIIWQRGFEGVWMDDNDVNFERRGLCMRTERNMCRDTSLKWNGMQLQSSMFMY